MLAEIAIANAAFGVIKEAIGNGKDLYEMGSVVAQFFDQKNALQKKSNKNGYKSDMEAFMELEKIKEMEEHLKQQMIWAGRPGMWDDWLAFQKKLKKNENKGKEKNARKKLTMHKWLCMYYTLFVDLRYLFLLYFLF